MFQELIDLVKSLGDDLAFLKTVNEYEAGIVYRFGSFHRKIKPGIRAKIPFVEEFKVVSTQDDIKTLPAQTVTTADDKQVVVAAVVNFCVQNPRKYYRRVLSDNDNVVDDLTASAIRDVFIQYNYKDLLELKAEAIVADKVKKAVRLYGLKVNTIKFSTFAKIRTYRFITDRADDFI